MLLQYMDNVAFPAPSAVWTSRIHHRHGARPDHKRDFVDGTSVAPRPWRYGLVLHDLPKLCVDEAGNKLKGQGRGPPSH
jgi:hypothetical protein